VSSRIVGIILNHFAVLDNGSNILAADHTFRPCHLLDGVRQKQESATSQSGKFLPDFAALDHTGIVSPLERFAKRQ
jgi:hypothetical protein